MSATAQAVFYIVAVVAFVLYALDVELLPGRSRLLLGAGLAAFAFVFAWNALAAT